jgi:hypothetical protein
MLLSALLILIGLVTKTFVTASWDEGTERAHIGFVGAEVCNDNNGGCKSLSWAQMWDIKKDIKGVRYLALLSGFAAIGVAVFAGVMAFQRKKVPTLLVNIVLGVTSFAFAYFIVRWMSEGHGEVQPVPGLSAGLAFAGLVLASVMQATVIKGFGAPAHAPPLFAAVPMCPACGQPAQFVVQHQRWYCARDGRYL